MSEEENEGWTNSNSYWVDLDSDESAFPPPSRLKIPNLGMLLLEQAEEIEQKCFVLYRDRTDNQWAMLSWREAMQYTLKLLSAFNSHFQLKAQDRLAIISGSRWEALICDFAAVCNGSIVVPIDPHLPARQIAQIFADTKPKVVCLEDNAQLTKLQDLTPHGDQSLAELRGVVSFEDLREEPTALKGVESFSIADILAVDEDFTSHALHRVKELVNRIHSSQPACMQYSRSIEAVARMSGGMMQIQNVNARKTKQAVVQTHANHLAMIDALLLSALLGPGENIYLGLPLSCSFARICAYAAVALGGSLIFPTLYTSAAGAALAPAKVIDQFRNDLHDSHPAVVLTDSALLGGICDTVMRKKGKLLQWSLKEKPSNTVDGGHRGVIAALRWELAQAVISKVKGACCGTRIQHFLIGGPPLFPAHAAEFFSLIGAPVLQGLWLPEATGAVSSNTAKWLKEDSLGRAFDGIEWQIDRNSTELLINGPAIALAPEAETSVPVATSVYGTISPDGYLFGRS